MRALRKIIPDIIRTCVFISGFLCILSLVSSIMRNKVHENDTVATFYEQKQDSLDVIFIGSSHSFSTFSPMELWAEEGITSYNIATGSQPIGCSYYLLQEAIRMQHPKLVVLETYSLNYIEDYNSKERIHQALDCIPLSIFKIRALNEYLSPTMSTEEQLEFLFPFLLYHNRWNDLRSRDFKSARKWLRGFYIQTNVEPQNRYMDDPVPEELYDRSVEYYEKIIELCRENQIKLVLCQSPMGEDPDNRRVYGCLKTVEEYAGSQGLPYINFDTLIDELGVDYRTDFADSRHLNVLGAEKTTKYIGTYLKENFQLTDHRSEASYLSWDQDYKEYKNYLKKVRKRVRKTAGIN